MGVGAPIPEAVQEIVARYGEDTTPGADSDAASGGVAEQTVPPVALAWLALLDLAVNPHLLRRHMKQRGAREDVIRAFLRFYVGRPKHSQSDRDKVDWLATYLFQAREERTKVPTGWPKTEVKELVQGFANPPLSVEAASLLTDLSSLLEEVRYFEKFVQFTDSRIIQRGRNLKDRFGPDFFHSDVLVAIINYNLVFGKKFYSLLQETVEEAREFASEIESGALDPRDLVHTDYRSTTDAFLHLGEFDRKRESRKRVKAATASTKSTSDLLRDSADQSGRWQRLKELGINPYVEAIALKQRREEITIRLKANPGVTALQGNLGTFQLSEWEAAAFRTSFPETEKSFRAEFANGITHAISILSLADDALESYNQKKDTEFLWKKYYDTLLFLLHEGRGHIERMADLAAETEKKGLSDKAKQLKQSAEKLENHLVAVAAVFSQ
jgi:hypothetical protein